MFYLSGFNLFFLGFSFPGGFSFYYAAQRLRICLVADCGRFNCQTENKFERAKSLAKCSKTAIRHMRCCTPCFFPPSRNPVNVER